LLTRLIPQNAIDLLSEVFEVHANTAERGLSREELLGAVADKDALLCLLSDKINAELMDKGKKLKVVSNYAVGYNNIDLDAAKERNIAVCNTPGVLTESTADIAWSLVMAAARRIPESGDFPASGQVHGLGTHAIFRTRRARSNLGNLRNGTHRPSSCAKSHRLWHAHHLSLTHSKRAGF